MPRSAAVVLLPAAAVAPVALPNGSLEDGAGALPTCWTGAGFGASTATFTRVPDARTGGRAVRIDMTAWTSGDRKLITTMDTGTCAPRVASGRRYVLRASYRSASAPRLLAYYRTAAGAWVFLGKSAATPHGGAWSETLSVTSITSGDRKVLSAFDPACAPPAIPGHPYLAGAWYRSDAPVRVVLYYRDAAGAWRFWAKSAPRPASAAWAPATLRSQPAPPGATALATGLLLDTPGTASVDDLSLADMG